MIEKEGFYSRHIRESFEIDLENIEEFSDLFDSLT